MRVKSIRVTGLFGVFNHEIPLQNPERVTIIHGPNGLGKTVMLRMIAAVIEGQTSIFEETPFNEFRLMLEDGTSRIIRRHVSTEEKRGKSRVRLELLTQDINGHTETVSPAFEGADVPQSILEHVDTQVPGPYVINEGGWRIQGEGRLHSLAEIIRMFPRAAALVPKKYRPSLLFEDLELFFVETNRLAEQTPAGSPHFDSLQYVDVRGHVVRDEARFSAPRVTQYSRDIQGRIQRVLAAYAKRSQESDRTYPERLVQFVRNREHAIPESEILNKMAELEKKRQRLISFGLLDSESGLRDLSEKDVKGAAEALTIYVGDVRQKLQVFDDLAERIGSLMDIVNDRFKYKRLTVDREKGFSVLSDLNQRIELENLSSGEQHELVLLYELLFRAPKNGLVLIDEPEISLHVAWQSRFLSDLIGILAVTDAYAIVATHSPVIIGNRRDLTVELQGPQR
jgi:predicted ATPase